MSSDSDPLEELLWRLLRERNGSICPSEIARSAIDGDWRACMPAVHALAERLAQSGLVVLTQRGRRLDGRPRGAYRISLPDTGA